ncbi:MAG TPA: 16S rRNA (guanine(527)-N(7))-methyltransferase RsmG [Caulobacteraceae bacterium]|jgi:16S rRNA (guanine527-N7)-methyltransferase|nr:16S rRNA (guanine(527)-N(7))-methyltransferase RsmG [Caulobacteraceae bacterium]
MSVVAPPDAAAFPQGFAERVGWTPRAQQDLVAFRLCLEAANADFNLVGPATLGDFWRRHVVDSAQLRWFYPRALIWADLGSGAGLPGLVLAILLKDTPGATIHLVESMAKRCRFLQDVVARLDLPAVVHNARAESLRLNVEIVTARACAPLERLLDFAWPYASRGARPVFLKGESVEDEILSAHARWRFTARLIPSLSDTRGRLVEIEGLKRGR